LDGVLASEAGRLEQAEEYLRLSHTSDAAFVPARVALAGLYFRLYRYDEALEVADRARPDTPEDAALELLLGEIYERLDNSTSAEVHFKAAAQLDRSDAKPALALAKLFRRSNRPLQAQRQLRVLLDKYPNHETARELLAFAYLDGGKLDEAIEQFEELRQRAGSPLVRARCAALLDQVRNGGPEAYREQLLTAMREHAPDAATWVAVAESHDARREAEPMREEPMREAYRQALACDPETEDAAVGLVRTSQRLLHFEEAAERLQGLLKRRPNRHVWRIGMSPQWRGLIGTYWILQDFDSALAVAREIEARRDLDARWREAYRDIIVNTLRRAGRSEDVAAQLSAWAEAEPENRVWSLELAREYIRQGKPSAAVPIVQAIHESDPDNRNHLADVVDALLAAGQRERASQYLLDWLDDDPENDQAASALAALLAEADRLDEARELIHNKLLHTRDREAFQDLLMDRLLRSQEYESCMEFIEGLIDEILQLLHNPAGHPAAELTPNEQRTRLPNEPWSTNELVGRLTFLRRALAQTLIMAQAFRDAEQRLSSWLETVPDPNIRFEFLRLLVVAVRGQGDERRAEKVMERALTLRPDSAGLNNDLAYGWIDRGVRLEESEPMIRHAVWREPFNGAYLDTYGWLQYKKGEFAEAKKWLGRAIRARQGDDPVVRGHLGDACWRLGETERAVEHWTAAAAVVAGRPADGPVSEDERRVRTLTQKKLDDARAGRSPAVAPLAVETAPKNTGAVGEPTGEDSE
jgi:predicted Zn-dependent protease